MSRIVPGSGAVLTPVFNNNYGVDYFIVESGGSGYASTDPPKIEILGQAPSSPGSFYPVIDNGSIVSVRVLDPGYGYNSTYGDFVTVSSNAEVVRRLPGNNILGITSFKLTSNDIPLFYREFDSDNGITTSVIVETNSFLISNHNFQTGQKIIYDYGDGIPIGIGTTSAVESNVNIITEVGGSGGGSIFEDGYNVAISTSISGVSANPGPGISAKVFGFGGSLPSFTNGSGSNAKFEVYITYDNSDGSPLSTSIVLKEGGGNYSVGDQVGISGTYLDGATPANDLTFIVSKVSSSRISGEANATYTNVSGITSTGPGSGAIFTVSRDDLGDISIINVTNGGSGYALTSTILLRGSDIGGNDINDNAFVSPIGLGTDILPNVLYVQKLSDNAFRVQGTPASENLSIESLGVGTHSFSLENPNANSLILIDNIIQSPIYNRNVSVGLAQSVGIGSTNIYLSVGISSISGLDFLKIGGEYLKIESVGIGSTNVVEVTRGYFGSEPSSHEVDDVVSVVRGDYNIVKDSIYFSTSPYGEIGLEGLKVSSTFQGKVFSRSFDLLNNPNDKNIILDDISVDFTGESFTVGIFTGTLTGTERGKVTGISTESLFPGDVLNLEYPTGNLVKLNTRINSVGVGSITISPTHNVSVGIATTTFVVTRLSFVLKSDGNTVVGLFTDTNGSGVDINNNPFILINNIPQTPEQDFTIDTIENNTIKFLSGVPNAGRITKVSISTSFGYNPLVGAAGTISISGFGTVSSINLTNSGSGYRVPPVISIGGTIGFGASFSATLGAGGTITSIDVINPGTGYTHRNEYFATSGITESVSVGSTVFYVDSTSNVSVGSSITVVGTGITNIAIVGVGTTFVYIGSGNTISSSIPSGSFVEFTNFSLPEILIPPPPQYSNIPLSYLSGTTGSGKNATAAIVISNDSSVRSFSLDAQGYGYKSGDKLVASGIVTDPNAGSNFTPLVITVTEELTDKFSGFYPGQFIRVDNISQYFNGKRRKFTLTKTEFGEKRVLDLKVDAGVSLNLQNNIFVYINDILQEPEVSYVYSGTRIIFTEPPKENSSCEIFYYRGSSLDVEEIIPPESIKEGDIIQIIDNKDDLYDITQFDRTVKKVISSSEFDTFSYDSIGINTITELARPLKWEKTTKDLIINGVLYPKARNGLKSKNFPTTRLIKNVRKTDSAIYVENAFPLFVADEDRGLIEDVREVNLVEKKNIEFPIITSSVSASSTISSVQILSSGFGYSYGSAPLVSISKAFIKKKDPILNWSSAGIGSTTESLNSLIYGDYFVSVGSSGKYFTSIDGILWQDNSTGYEENLTDIIKISNNYIGVGSDARIIKGVGIGTTIVNWSEIKLSKPVSQFGFVEIQDSQYISHFNKISYMPTKDIAVAVGDISPNIGYCPIFVSAGVGLTEFFEKATTNNRDLKSITNNNNFFVTVGKTGIIRYSSNGETWTIVGNFNKPTNVQNLNDVIWDGSRFIAVGDNGELLVADSPQNWSRVSNNLSNNILKIKYYDEFYVVLDDLGNLYYSFDLLNWSLRSTLQSKKINDLVFVQTLGDFGRYVAVGSASTIIYAEPVFNRATAVSTVNPDSTLASISVVNGGFGYSESENPPVIVESETYNVEKLRSVKVEGDFGTIIKVEPVGTAVTYIKFSLKSEYYDNSTYQSSLGLPGIGYSSLNTFRNELGELITYSQLEVGDYFVINNSNVISDYPLVGISTFNGFVEYVGMTTTNNIPIAINDGILSGTSITGIDTTGLLIGDLVSTYEVNYLPENTTISSIGSSSLVLSNQSQVTGILTSYILFERPLINLDGVFVAEEVSTPDVASGIVTVTCKFAKIPGNQDIVNVLGIGTEQYYGSYSWSKIYGYQNRSRGVPKEFYSYNMNGIIGLSTSADVYRTRPLIWR